MSNLSEATHVEQNDNNYAFKTLTYSTVLKYLVGDEKIRQTEVYPSLGGIPTPQATPWDQRIETVANSCAFTTATACVAGGAFGVVFGLFMIGMESRNYTEQTPTIRGTLKEMGAEMKSKAKNFAIVGAMFSATHCVIEKHRGVSDMWNSTSSGFVTGTVLGLRLGLRAGLAGGLGFAAFSTAIDYYFAL